MTYFVLCDGRPLPANDITELDQPLRPVEFDSLEKAQEYISNFDEFAGRLSILPVNNAKVVKDLLVKSLNE